MIQSLDGSSRDIINSIDSANKITAKQFMNQHFSDSEARIKITKQQDVNLEENNNQPNPDALGKSVNIVTSLADNVLQEKTKSQIFLESIFYAFGNFTIVYYIILFVGSAYYGANGFYNQLYLGITLGVCFLISFYDNLANRLHLFNSIEKSDIQKIQTYVQDGFQECSVGELQRGNIIKILPKQKCPVDGIILGTAGVSENVPLLEIGGQTITRRAGVTGFSLSKQLEGIMEFDNDEKKFRVTLKMDNNQLCLDFQQQHKIRILQTNNSYDDIYILVTNQTLRQQKAEQSSAYEKTKINPKLAFSLHIQNLFMIMFTLLMVVILLALHFIQTKYLYLDDKIQEGMMKTYFQFLCVFSWGIPIFQFPLIYIINRVSKFQAENDQLLDVDLSGKKIEIINSNVLANMARAKYILTDLQLLTRKTKAVSNLFLNKASEEINLNDLVTLTPIEDIDDHNFCQQEARFALLAFDSKSKTEEDIAIQKKLLSHGLIVGIKPKLRIIQDLQQNQTYYHKKFELVSSKFKLFGYEQILKENVKQHLIVFRQKYIDCKESLSSEIQIQISQLVDNKDNINDIIIVFKKIVSMQYLDRITKIIEDTKSIDNETLKQIKLDVEPIIFIEIDDEFYDCSQELSDISRCEYKIWINCHIKDIQNLEHDPTIATLMEQVKVQQISCQNGDELQVALDQLEKNCQIKTVGKQQSYHFNNTPILLVIDNVSLQIGLNNQLLNEKFRNVFLKVPIILLLNSKPHLNYQLMKLIQSHEIICATNYLTSTPSMQIALDNNSDTPSDLKLPNFSFLPKILIVHGRLNNIRQQQSINFQNYVACILFVFQFSYSCYNRYSQKYLLNEFIYFIAMIFTQLYCFLFFSMAQDFNFEILKNQPVYHLMVRTPKNPYRLLLTQFGQGLVQGTFILFSTIFTFYGSNDQNGYVHGYQLHQFISLTVMLSVIAFKPIIDQYKVVKSQIYLAFLYLISSIYIVQKNNGNMSELFATGIKTKDLCALVFFPICALSPNLISKFGQRMLSTNNLNYCLYKMEVKYDEEVENQKLRDAKNYIKLYQKEEDEPQEDIVNSKKVL